MGQNTSFADWFINATLGWVRWIAGNIASMFQTSSSRGSTGNALLGWFSDHWLALLVVLIVLGVLVDWLVWMIRWRPYWLWFRKKRILYDDDIDIDLSDEELLRRYGTLEPFVDKNPHFKASPLGRAGRPLYEPEPADDATDLDELYEDVPDIEDPYDGEDALDYYQDYDYDFDEDDDYVPPKKQREKRQPQRADEDDDEPEYEQDERFDALYDVQDEEDFDDEADFLGGEDDLDAPDLSEPEQYFKPRKSWFKPRNRKKDEAVDEDPFSVDDDTFDEEDDDFYERVSEPPEYEKHQQSADLPGTDTDTSVYKRPQDAEVSEELTPESAVKDWRTGYSQRVDIAPTEPTSRRARRRNREMNNEESE